jgi:hypothetical protein
MATRTISPGDTNRAQNQILVLEEDDHMRKDRVFWLFGSLQSVTLSAIIYLLFDIINKMSETQAIGMDTQIVLSGMFPLFLLLVEYSIYSKY